MLAQCVSFCFETVFSPPSKIDFIAAAKGLGYTVVLVCIHLNTPGLNEARVSQRVSEEGHSVPIEKIHTRLPRTLKRISTALPLADDARLLNNSFRDDPFRLVAIVKKGRRKWTCDRPAGLGRADNGRHSMMGRVLPFQGLEISPRNFKKFH